MPLYCITIILFISGLFLTLSVAPSDYLQSENYRIIYIHVPAAWMSLILYCSLALFSFVYIIKSHPFVFILAEISCKIGMIFTLLTLFTGSLWGIPMWGTFWVWDARLTSVLILFLIFLGYFVLTYFFNENQNSRNIASVLAIFGLLNLPILKFSVNWWNTLHQSASISEFGTTIHISMVLPLFLMFFSYGFFTLMIFNYELRKNLILRKIIFLKSLY